MKKFLLIGIAIGSIATTSLLVFAQVMLPQNFQDVDSNSWYAHGVYKARDEGWMQGYNNGLFGPFDNVKRAQLATILERYNQKVEQATNDLKTIICLNKANATNNLKIQFSNTTEQQQYEEAIKNFCSNDITVSSPCAKKYDPKTGETEMGPCA